MPSYVFDHIHLISPDPAKTADFYAKTFGAKKVIKDLGPGRQAVSVDLAGTSILIRQAGDADKGKPSLDHYGLRTDNLEAAIKELKAAGVEVTMEIRAIRPDFKIAFIRTPDGVSIEIVQGVM